MKITRVWAMPNKWTFTIKPIKELIIRYMGNSTPWADPFAGMYSPAQIRNDINPSRNAEYNLDALAFMRTLESNSCAGVLFDPPYSFHKLSKLYSDTIKPKDPTAKTYRASMKKEIGRVLQTDGISISFGWNTNGVNSGIQQYEILEVLIVPHGDSRNDTLVTVQQKIQSTIEEFDCNGYT